jgi:hypothetical protein
MNAFVSRRRPNPTHGANATASTLSARRAALGDARGITIYDAR